MLIGDLGVGTNSRIASIEFGDKFRDYNSVEGICSGLKIGDVERIVVPVENRMKGVIETHVDLIRSYGFRVVGSVRIPIIHNLAVNNRSDLNNIGFVMSHKEALRQCSDVLDDILPYAHRAQIGSTGMAAEFISGTRGNGAAIANNDACENYDLRILEADLVPGNWSEFWLCEK
jgi:prephenate dehydratase